jgi:predicted extracellular nuclease
LKSKFFFAALIILNLSAANLFSLKILWWNVNNFFDVSDDPAKEDSVLSKKEYDKKISNVSFGLKKINADVAGLCEVENISILKELAAKSNYPNYYLIEGNDPRGIDICLLSKIKIEYTSHKDQLTPYKEDKNYKFSRDCPEAKFEYKNKKIYLLLNHLKSEYNSDDNEEEKELTVKKRIAQVDGILDIVSEIYKKNEEPLIILTGDLNSRRYSEPLNILQKSGLKILNYSYNEDNIFTMKYKNNKMDIDYFIFNDILFNKSKIKKLKAYNKKQFEEASDHFPLLLEFDI